SAIGRDQTIAGDPHASRGGHVAVSIRRGRPLQWASAAAGPARPSPTRGSGAATGAGAGTAIAGLAPMRRSSSRPNMLIATPLQGDRAARSGSSRHRPHVHQLPDVPVGILEPVPVHEAVVLGAAMRLATGGDR